MKGYGKRIVSAVLVVALLIALLPSLIGENSYYAEASGQPERLDTSKNDDNTHRIRGVVDRFGELPPTTEGKLGSPSNPFLVLEIVPYEEYAEFGYLISGCEPVNIHDIFIDRKVDNGFDVIKTLDKLGTAYITPMGTVYFFEDEDEEYAKFAEYFDDEGNCTIEGVSYPDVVYGYFQRVDSGEGDWKIIESEDSVSPGDSGDVSPGDSGDVSPGDSETGSDEGDEEKPFPFEKVGFGEGEWIWHTFSNEEREKHEAEFETSSDDSDDASNDDLTKAGAYKDPSTLNPDDLADITKYPEDVFVYTWRTPTEEQKCIQVENYYTYENKDLFLRQTLGLSDEDVENYSIVVKTITPSELKKSENQQWIERANLIYLSSSSHKEDTTAAQPTDQPVGHNDSDLAKIWGADGEGNGYGYGWLFREGRGTTPNSHPYYGALPTYAGTDKNNNDLDWDTVRKLYDKVTKETDYAALIMDDYIYNPNSSLFTGTTKNSFQINVYDWNLNKTSETWTIQKDSSNNNIYKLGIMLMAMDSSLFKNLYLEPVNDGKDALIVDGIDTRRKAESNVDSEKGVAIQADYWSVETFFLDIPSPYRQADYATLQAYWESDELWNYHSTTNPTDSKYKYWVNDHVFTCPGGKGILTGYEESYSEEVKNNNYEKLFSEFMSSESVENPQAPRPADAVNYILRNIEKEPEETKQTVNVLDLEPSVGLVINGDGSVGGYNWFLTESYVQMLLGGTDKDINITHQTTAEFISKTEDLVSTYHLIYIGLDVGAYNTIKKDITLSNNSGNSSVNLSLPAWNDGSLGHLIYTHSGDWLLYQKGVSGTNNDYNPEENPKWVWTGSEESLKNSTYKTTNDIIPEADWYVRFPGNDISHKKMLELETFIAAGHPVVAERYLYNLEKQLIDQNSFIYQFVSINAKKEYLYDSKAVAAARPDFECQYCLEGKSHPSASSTQVWSKVYSTADVVDIARDFGAAFDFREKVSFEEWPQIYNEHDGDGNPLYQYLKVEGNVAVLPFSWKINDKSNDWLYRIYIDLDGDSKFEYREDYSEIIEEGKVYADSQGEYSTTTACYITAEIPGPVQWKIEVYQNTNPNEKYVKTGCSAVPATINGEENKTTIKVLQIRPSENGNPNNKNTTTGETGLGFLNMADEASGFKKLFDELKDYKIELTSIVYAKYESYFTANNTFDYNVDVTGKITDLGNWEDTYGLLDYDVIVVGFEDSSGLEDISDAYGAVQFLWFWVDQGRGILFTHDLTSMYISLDVTDDSEKHYGTRVSNLLRDAMGMNRYGAISAYAGNDRVEKLLEYQKQQVENDSDNVHFDWMKDPLGKVGKKIGRQGYTYVAMYFFSMKAHMNKSASTPKMLYQNLPDATETADWLSVTASRVNEGTVTAYPYEIRERLTVAETHTQYYSMNPEDEDVVVWYSLAENQVNGYYSYYVSPNDGLNNYYIYSRNNVFYSGVGHQKVVPGSEEAKLLVNVIIAAYNAGKSRASYVLVEDAEQIAAKDGAEKSYEVKLTQNYDGWSLDDDEQYLYKLDKEDLEGEDDDYIIKFRPLDAERQASWYECVIVYEYTDKDGNIYKEIFSQTLDAPLGVYKVDSGNRVGAVTSTQTTGLDALELGDGVMVLRLNNNEDYYLKFNRNDMFWKKLMNNEEVDVDSCRIVFYLRNNITFTKWAKTTVDVSILPLFLLE